MELEFEADCKLNAVENGYEPRKRQLYVDQQNIIQH